jgi:hypothetical protein
MNESLWMLFGLAVGLIAPLPLQIITTGLIAPLPLQILTTNICSTVANSQPLQFNTACTKSSQFAMSPPVDL